MDRRRTLSDRLRKMRFMKTNEESKLREKLAVDQAAREKEEQWTADRKEPETGPIILIEEGTVNADNYNEMRRYARRSFLGFNPVFEGGYGASAHSKRKVKEKPELSPATKKEARIVDSAAKSRISAGLGSATSKGRHRKSAPPGVRKSIAKKGIGALDFRQNLKSSRNREGYLNSRPNR